MRGRLADIAVGLNGKQRITVEIDGDFSAEYGRLENDELDIEIKKHRRRRSLDANAYAWVLIDKIAGALALDKETVYRTAIRGIGGVSETVCVREQAVQGLRRAWESNGIGWQTETMPSKIGGCANVVLYYGSSLYDTKQMSGLIEHLVSEARELGIETMAPGALCSLIESGRP
jgi:hypothetical protein